MKHTFILSVLLYGTILFGQQTDSPRQFWNNQTHINPAFSGLEYQLQGGVLYRWQQSQIEGRPIDVYGFFNTRIAKCWGIGMNMNYGTVGFNTTTEFHVPMSYRFQINAKHTLALGAGIGYGKLETEGLFVLPQFGTEPYMYFGKQENLFGSAGLAYDTRYFTAATSIRSIRLANLGDAGPFDFVPTYSALVRGKLPFGNNSRYFQKSLIILEALYNYQGGFQELQINTRVLLKEHLTFFAGIQNLQGIVIGTGWDFYKKLRATYAISFIRRPLSTNGGYTHEASIVYQLPATK
jgi:type IX secretion system PorP/SprF family membrane protein